MIPVTKTPASTAVHAAARLVRPSVFIMAVVLITLGFWLLYPVLLLAVYTFNVAPEVFFGTPQWGLDNWRVAFDRSGIFVALGNSVLIWSLTLGISLPVGTLIAWILARTNVRFSNGLELMFWVSYMIPGLATTIGWIALADPRLGMLNTLLMRLPFVDGPPFDIYSVAGIVWANLMGNGIAVKVMLLTPAFRNMDASLEEASRVSGASNVMTMIRVTLPLMVSPIVLVLALQLLKVFQSFETELLLGSPIGFFVYSTMIYDLLQREPPRYGQAAVLASLTMVLIALIVPLQRWVLHRRRYTTLTAGFRPGLIDLGRWRRGVEAALWSLIFALTLLPLSSLIFGSFMVRAGYFGLNRIFTSEHWLQVLTDRSFSVAVSTTIILGVTAAILSPLLFSLLAYILVRTKWRGRGTLDWIIWSSGAIPGILSGLGLLVMFLGTPGLSILYGTIWALVLVVVISGNTTGVNIIKGTFVQVGQDMEDAARIAGAGWLRTYWRIWIPLMMPVLILLAIMNFTHAVGATGSIILLASRETMTLSLLALEYRLVGASQEAASVISIVITLLTVVLAFGLRWYGLRMGVRHQQNLR